MAKADVKKTKTSPKKKVERVTESGRVYITATFNNTLVTITNNKGDTVGWSSAGASGFKGTRKSTPFAASTAVEAVAKKAAARGLKSVEVYIKGPGEL
jgi:small subunit ribosomal protein S11